MSNKPLSEAALVAEASVKSNAAAVKAGVADVEPKQKGNQSAHDDHGAMPFGNFQHPFAWGDSASNGHGIASPDHGDFEAAKRPSLFVRDRTAPTVTSFEPSDGSSDVDTATNITLTFSEDIRAGRGSIEIRVGSSRGPVVESFEVASSTHLSFDGNTLTIDPSSDLDAETHYYVVLARGTVTDLAGNSYSGTKTYDFTTEAGADTTAPVVTLFSPSDGSSDVEVGSNIILTFSEAIQAGSGSIEIHEGSATGALIESFDVASSGNLSFSGSTLTIDPTSDLDIGTHYYVTIGSDAVVDLAGNSYAGTTDYDFTTEAPDTEAPTVTSFSPSDDSADVDPGTSITLTFSEAIQAGSGSIEIREGSATGTVIESYDAATSGNLSFSGSTLTIDPSSDLGAGTHYYVTIGSDAVVDLAGNSYAGTTDYDFTTEAAPEPVLWDSVSGYGLLDIDAMLEAATGLDIADAALYGDGYGSWDWGLNDIQAPDAWQAGYTGEGIVVAVIDSGVLYTHSDLAGNIWTNSGEIAGDGIDNDGNGYVDDIYGYDFVNNDGYALDDNGHGTHVAGIIAGLDNGTGVTGVAYDATIMPVKVLDSSGSGSFTAVANGIVYAVDNGADVINLSLGAYGAYSSSVTSAISYALDHGVIVCMASGNDSQSSPTYPAILAETLGGIAVGAVNSSNTVASFSNDAGDTEPYDFVVAPGVSIYSTYSNGGYASMSGTSMATPYAAGAAALLLSAEADYASNWTLEELENILTNSAEFLGTTSVAASGESDSTAAAASTAGFDAGTEADFISVVEAEPVALTGVLDAVLTEYDMFAV